MFWVETTAQKYRTILLFFLAFNFFNSAIFSMDNKINSHVEEKIGTDETVIKSSMTSLDANTMLTENLTLVHESCRNNSIVPENWCMDDNKVPRYVRKENWPP